MPTMNQALVSHWQFSDGSDITLKHLTIQLGSLLGKALGLVHERNTQNRSSPFRSDVCSCTTLCFRHQTNAWAGEGSYSSCCNIRWALQCNLIVLQSRYPVSYSSVKAHQNACLVPLLITSKMYVHQAFLKSIQSKAGNNSLLHVVQKLR